MLTHFSELTLDPRYGVSKECSEYAQSHFVNKRKEEAEQAKQAEGSEGTQSDRKAPETTQDTFHHWLITSRLVAISQGCYQMEIPHFEKALELEDERKLRVTANK